MPNDNLFSGIPALDDAAGLEQYVNNSTLTDMGLGNPTVPAALQTQDTAQPAAPAQDIDPTSAPATPAASAPQYTADQVSQIIARNQQLEARAAQVAQAQARAQQSQAAGSAYTPRQAAIIKQLIDRGVPIERIQQALNGNRQQAAQQTAVMQRLQQVEAYLQNQQYVAEQNAFIDKMTTFGDKFGLSEDDLVTFGNAAMAKGINLTTVHTSDDVEAVFRAIYPEQYAIRSQRLAGANTSYIYGGASTPETPRAAAAKLEDAYVDSFLRQSMPNQYSQFSQK